MVILYWHGKILSKKFSFPPHDTLHKAWPGRRLSCHFCMSCEQGRIQGGHGRKSKRGKWSYHLKGTIQGSLCYSLYFHLQTDIPWRTMGEYRGCAEQLGWASLMCNGLAELRWFKKCISVCVCVMVWGSGRERETQRVLKTQRKGGGGRRQKGGEGQEDHVELCSNWFLYKNLHMKTQWVLQTS